MQFTTNLFKETSIWIEVCLIIKMHGIVQEDESEKQDR